MPRTWAGTFAACARHADVSQAFFPNGISRLTFSRLDISITNLEPGILEQTIAVSAIGPHDEPDVHANDDLNVDSNDDANDEPKSGPGKRNRFPRSGRLLRHADFERVYKQGRRHFSTSMTFFYLPRTPAEAQSKTAARGRGGQERSHHNGPRVGFTVGRALGGAVVRNRMKRRLREAVRLAQVSGAGAVDVVINPKKTLLVNDFQDVLNEVRRAFVIIQKQVIEKKVGEKSSPESRAASRERPAKDRRAEDTGGKAKA